MPEMSRLGFVIAISGNIFEPVGGIFFALIAFCLQCDMERNVMFVADVGTFDVSRLIF